MFDIFKYNPETGLCEKIDIEIEFKVTLPPLKPIIDMSFEEIQEIIKIHNGGI